MGFLESVGLLAVIILSLAIAVYFTIGADQYVEGNKELIECSEKCQLLIGQSRADSINGIRSLSGTQLNRKLRRVLQDPDEFEKASKKLNNKRKVEAQQRFKLIENRIVGSQYDISIFEIFGTKRILTEKELCSKIETKLNVNEAGAKRIFKIWHDHDLISRDFMKANAWSVGCILLDECYKLNQNDLIRSEWLKKNDLELEKV